MVGPEGVNDKSLRAFITLRASLRSLKIALAIFEPLSVKVKVFKSAIQKNHRKGGLFIWWARKDLNLRPADYESDALTN